VNNYQIRWYELLKKHRAIAVIRADNLNDGLAMAQAVANGGIKLIEVTWNSVNPDILVSKLRIKLSDCIIGVGTILDEESLDLAINAGAEFIFSPHTNLELINQANYCKIPIIPGAFSPTEIVNAWQNKATCVKVFPINILGGISYLKALQGPLGSIPLIPTGGVTINNAVGFIKAGAIAVGLSSDLFPKDAILNKDWQQITKKAELLCNLIIK
jgi:2-dehydro-3-deoxyphosphogluconate aldolase/(4S)-4-hydroxy-2-oxoglutarate aldolase